ncbi:hypothetical protein GQR58_026611 [Nymphon striatum]|nr:hypothetical protein GQR58_026611 [Nymphon striatum]
MRMTLWLSKPKDPNDSSLEEVDTPQMHDSEECIQDSPTFSTPGASMESTPKTPEGLDYDIVLRNARHLKKYKVSEINYDILFKDTWNNLDFADVIDKLYIVFEDVIRRVTGNLKNTDQIRVYINQYSLETPITVPLMLVGDLGPQQILDAIEKVLQSAKKIVFDQSLQVIFGTALVPVAGGELYPHKMQDPAHIKRKRSMVYITEQGHMCMARAICVGTFALKDRKKYEATRRVHSKAQTLEARSMKSTEREHFLKWYEEVKDETFDFKKELVAYCLNDVEILAKSCIKFRELFMDAAGVDPLQTITVSSACIASFRSKFCQELYDIDGTSTVITGRIFPKHNTKTFIKSYFPFIKPNKDVFSAAAIKWLEWMAAKNNIFIAHACNLGEYRVPGTKYRLDGYHAESKTAYEFHSCLHHGCTICYPFREFRILHLNKKVDELYNLTMIKKKILLDRGFLYICIWHHEYLEKANTDIEFKKFIDSQDVPERLDPRDALYGGRTNAVQLYYKPEIGEKIRYVDFTSLYPYINKTREYMTCPPVIITRGFKDINSYFGFIKCVILPPRGLYHPVLPYRTGGKLLFPLCSTCADAGINRRCKCSDKDRSLKGTWTTVEIQKALSLQYKIVKIYEVWHYPETTIYSSTSKGLFSDYINTFLKFKEQSSGYPSTCVTVKDQEEYKQAYFEKEGVILGDMSPNPGLRSVAKLSLNNIWGKLAQRNNMSQVLFCDKPSDFFMALTDPTKIVTDFKIITDVMVMLVYTNSSESSSYTLLRYILTPFSSKSFDISICKGLFTTLVVLGIHQCVETFPPPVLPPLSLSTIYCFFFSLTGTQ